LTVADRFQEELTIRFVLCKTCQKKYSNTFPFDLNTYHIDGPGELSDKVFVDSRRKAFKVVGYWSYFFVPVCITSEAEPGEYKIEVRIGQSENVNIIQKTITAGFTIK
jgi:hypothetical protein